ncbi:MAG: porin [Alcanivoracaceae bacterium]|nr:porin [Alcanivoracaceae bacterium]
MLKKTALVAGLSLCALNAQAQTLEELQSQIDILAQEIESLKTNTSGGSALDNIHIGGYGELHYNNYLDSDTRYNDVTDSGHDDQIDAHRFVLYFGYDFTDTVRFVSEFELEHSLAGDGKPGEVELEQAYIEVDTSENTKVKAGLFLVPVGLMNETHEPDTFYGVERNLLENKIIPTTWWETGAMFSQNVGAGLSYDIAAHSGLDMLTYDNGTTTFGVNSIRSGRKKSAEAPANKGAVTGRVRYSGVPGLDLGVSMQYQQDVFQASPTISSVSATLVEAHAVYSIAQATFTVMQATWNFDDAIADVSGSKAATKQDGFLAEASYRFNPHVGVFTRYTAYDNGAGDSVDSEVQAKTVGVNYWIVPRVVVKADYNDISYDASGKDDGADDTVSLGLGWSF